MKKSCPRELGELLLMAVWFKQKHNKISSRDRREKSNHKFNLKEIKGMQS
jgi:hypothetical protein